MTVLRIALGDGPLCAVGQARIVLRRLKAMGGRLDSFARGSALGGAKSPLSGGNLSAGRAAVYVLALLTALASIAPAIAQDITSPPQQGAVAQAAGSTSPEPSTTAPVSRPDPSSASQPQQPAPAPAIVQPAPASPQAATGHPTEIIPDYLRPISDWNTVLDRIELLVGEPSVSDRTLVEARQELIDLERQIRALRRALRPRLAVARAQAERLGSAPAANQPPEASAIAQQRSAVGSEAANLSGAINAAEAALLRAEHLADRIRDVRRQGFQEDVLQRGPSVLSPDLRSQVAEDVPAGFERLRIILSDWQAIPDPGRFLRLLLAATLIAVVLTYIAWRSIRRYRHWDEPEAPPEWRRVASAAWVIALRALPMLAAIAFLLIGLSAWEPLPSRLGRLVEAALFAFGVVVVVQAVSRTVLALSRPHWRLIHLSDEAAWRLYIRVLLLAVVYGGDRIASALNEAASVPYSLNVAQSFVASILYAGLIISILLIKAPAFEPGRRPERIGRAYVRLPLWLVATAILIAALTGYVALARFIAGQLIVITTIATITYLFLVWASAFGKSLSDDRTRVGIWLRERLGLEKRRREQIALPITLILQTAIIVAAIPFVMLQWGFDWQDVGEQFRAALFGFQVGNAHISVMTVIAAVLVFTLGYIAAKIFQGWLDSQVLEPAGVDTSVRHSVRIGVGYLGVGLAALLALSYAGLDISNLALIAGALSVGIGFGLQGVVNNFISGLILLAERPIKVGDWIIVGGDEGIVRRISVRSTEIETFERSNVIVPNAVLIAEKVKNWTLHNNTGRYTIKVAVHFDADPEKVREILLGIARDHPQILSTPEPFVYLDEFGAHALHFTLYVYLGDVSRSLAVRTDLRIAILKAFRGANIEMPYPQADVHFRDLGWVRAAVTERLSKGEGTAVTRRDFTAESGLTDHDDENGD
jgi:potassium efflux system protein